MNFFLFCGFAGDLLFLSAIRKKKITKRRVVEDYVRKKTAGYRSGAKKSLHFPKRKELATLKQAAAIDAGGLLFLSAIRKKKITKRKTASSRYEAKIFTLSLKKKNSLRSNSFFFFTGKSKNFFTLLH